MINYVWPVPRAAGWLRVTFSELFKVGLMGFLGLCDWNTSSLTTTGGTINSWVPNGHSTSNWCRFDVDITSIGRKKISTNFHVISRNFFKRNFERRKIDVVWTCFVWRNFDGQKIDVISMYFFLNVILMDENSTSFWCTFSMQFRWIEYLYWCVFGR